ncbi:hypothetical protein BCU84_03295 [Shewanella sp. 10N.286.51.B7]|nr:hypothetical protein BCU84_03295 [Shewanella sp. 10N.286.51.B7]
MDGESEAIANSLYSMRNNTSSERQGMSRREMLLFPFRRVWAKRHDLDLAFDFNVGKYVFGCGSKTHDFTLFQAKFGNT